MAVAGLAGARASRNHIVKTFKKRCNIKSKSRKKDSKKRREDDIMKLTITPESSRSSSRRLFYPVVSTRHKSRKNRSSRIEDDPLECFFPSNPPLGPARLDLTDTAT